MKPNRLKQLVAEGRVPVGHMVLEFGTRGMAKILESAGADFVLIDMEHGAFDTAAVADQVAWLKATPLTPIVRIPQPLYHFAARVLDAGALGVMVPNVASAEQARAVVDAVKYAPLGRRGVIVGGAHGDFQPSDIASFLERSNANTTVICQIESREGLANLEAIAAVPGVDVLWLGHFDLTNFLGIPAQFDHPKYVAAIDKMTAAARKHNQVLACLTADDAWSRQYWAKGFRLFAVGVDAMLLQGAIRQGMKTLNELAGR